MVDSQTPLTYHVRYMPSTASKKSSFEDSLKKLESIVNELESGEVSLDEALKKYERGLKLVKSCQERLNEAEKKLKILSKDSKGNFELRDED